MLAFFFFFSRFLTDSCHFFSIFPGFLLYSPHIRVLATFPGFRSFWSIFVVSLQFSRSFSPFSLNFLQFPRIQSTSTTSAYLVMSGQQFQQHPPPQQHRPSSSVVYNNNNKNGAPNQNNSNFSFEYSEPPAGNTTRTTPDSGLGTDDQNKLQRGPPGFVSENAGKLAWKLWKWRIFGVFLKKSAENWLMGGICSIKPIFQHQSRTHPFNFHFLHPIIIRSISQNHNRQQQPLHHQQQHFQHPPAQNFYSQQPPNMRQNHQGAVYYNGPPPQQYGGPPPQQQEAYEPQTQPQQYYDQQGGQQQQRGGYRVSFDGFYTWNCSIFSISKRIPATWMIPTGTTTL